MFFRNPSIIHFWLFVCFNIWGGGDLELDFKNWKELRTIYI